MIKLHVIQKQKSYHNGMDDAMLMVAHRPLHGSSTWIGESVYGRHWSAIDLTDELANGWIERNEKLDCREVVVVTEKEAIDKAWNWCVIEYGSPHVVHSISKVDDRQWLIEKGLDLMNKELDNNN